jgi:hypothetical protein
MNGTPDATDGLVLNAPPHDQVAASSPMRPSGVLTGSVRASSRSSSSVKGRIISTRAGARGPSRISSGKSLHHRRMRARTHPPPNH